MNAPCRLTTFIRTDRHGRSDYVTTCDTHGRAFDHVALDDVLTLRCPAQPTSRREALQTRLLTTGFKPLVRSVAHA